MTEADVVENFGEEDGKAEDEEKWRRRLEIVRCGVTLSNDLRGIRRERRAASKRIMYANYVIISASVA